MAFKYSIMPSKLWDLIKAHNPRLMRLLVPLNPIECLPPEGKELYLGMHGKNWNLSDWSKCSKHRRYYEY